MTYVIADIKVEYEKEGEEYKTISEPIKDYNIVYVLQATQKHTSKEKYWQIIALVKV